MRGGQDATLRAIEDKLLLWSQGAEFRRADLSLLADHHQPSGGFKSFCS